MGSDIEAELHRDLPPWGSGRTQYTRRAFEMLPRIEGPRILDIGCGRGEPTLELAVISGGTVTGLDIDQPALDELERRAEDLGLSDRVRTVNRSLLELDLPDEGFDVVWSEGSIWVIGFERGLTEWRRLIRPDGFLVVHEMCWLRPDPPREIRDRWEREYPAITTVQGNLDLIPGCGYGVVGHFSLPEEAWWYLYYGPLEERVQALRESYADDPRALAVLKRQEKEIDLYRKYSKWYGSAFFVTRKM